MRPYYSVRCNCINARDLNLVIICATHSWTQTLRTSMWCRWKTPAEDMQSTREPCSAAHTNSKRSNKGRRTSKDTDTQESGPRVSRTTDWNKSLTRDIAMKLQNGRVKVLQVSKEKKQSTKKRWERRLRALAGEMANWLRARAVTRAGKIWRVTLSEGKARGRQRGEQKLPRRSTSYSMYSVHLNGEINIKKRKRKDSNKNNKIKCLVMKTYLLH